MLFEVIGEDVRVRLAQSFAVVERHRDDIVRKIEERLAALDPEEQDGHGRIVALLLVNLLVDGGCDLAAFGGLRDLTPAVKEHRRLQIGGRHYSRFGMALGPVLREVLGPSLSPRIVSAWCDAFWHMIGAMEPDEKLKIVRN